MDAYTKAYIYSCIKDIYVIAVQNSILHLNILNRWKNYIYKKTHAFLCSLKKIVLKSNTSIIIYMIPYININTKKIWYRIDILKRMNEIKKFLK